MFSIDLECSQAVSDPAKKDLMIRRVVGGGVYHGHWLELPDEGDAAFPAHLRAFFDDDGVAEGLQARFAAAR